MTQDGAQNSEDKELSESLDVIIKPDEGQDRVWAVLRWMLLE
jgi:hypothetical protein